MLKKILMILLVVIGVIVLIWFLFFRHARVSTSPTATSTGVTLKIPILQNSYPGQISATSTNVASGNTATSTVTQTPTPQVPIVSTPTQPAPQTKPIAKSQAVPEWQWFNNLGIKFRVPKNTQYNTSSSKVSFTQNSYSPFGYLEVIDAQNSTLPDLTNTISKSPDVASVQNITIAGYPAIEYTGTSYQKNGLVVLANNKYYYLYGALLKHSIRDTISFN